MRRRKTANHQRAEHSSRQNAARNAGPVSTPSSSAEYETRTPVKSAAQDVERLAARPAARRHVRRKLSRRLHSRLVVARPRLTAMYSGARALSLWLLIVCAYVLYLFGSSDLFYVDSVFVTGNTTVTSNEIARASRAANLSVFYLDFNQMASQVNAVSGVRNVTVTYEFPNLIHLNVVERTPLFVWDSNKRAAWVDDSGLIFPARATLTSTLTIRDLDNQTRTSVDAKLLTSVKAISAALPNLKRLDYADTKGLSFVDEHNWRVLLGQPEQINAKLAMLQSLTNYLVSQKVDIEYVDVRLPERAFYKPK